MSKGQWFLISAVIATGVFLAISVLFRGYSIPSGGEMASLSGDFYFENIRDQLNELDCNDVDYNKNFDEFKYFTQNEMTGMGYFLYLEKTGCPATYHILLASENAMFYQNVDPDDILGTG